MLSTAVASGLFKLALMLIGIGIARLALMFFDTHLASDDFQQWIKGANDEARATYLGLRFLGICLAVGLILG